MLENRTVNRGSGNTTERERRTDEGMSAKENSAG
jgi:hypothetical protein